VFFHYDCCSLQACILSRFICIFIQVSTASFYLSSKSLKLLVQCRPRLPERLISTIISSQQSLPKVNMQELLHNLKTDISNSHQGCRWRSIRLGNPKLVHRINALDDGKGRNSNSNIIPHRPRRRNHPRTRSSSPARSKHQPLCRQSPRRKPKIPRLLCRSALTSRHSSRSKRNRICFRHTQSRRRNTVHPLRRR